MTLMRWRLVSCLSVLPLGACTANDGATPGSADTGSPVVDIDARAETSAPPGDDTGPPTADGGDADAVDAPNEAGLHLDATPTDAPPDALDALADAAEGGPIVLPDGQVCRDTSQCPLFPGLPTKAVITCGAPEECPTCYVPQDTPRACATPGLHCVYTGANLSFDCTCTAPPADAGADAGGDAASTDGGPGLAFRCLG